MKLSNIHENYNFELLDRVSLAKDIRKAMRKLESDPSAGDDMTNKYADALYVKGLSNEVVKEALRLALGDNRYNKIKRKFEVLNTIGSIVDDYLNNWDKEKAIEKLKKISFSEEEAGKYIDNIRKSYRKGKQQNL